MPLKESSRRKTGRAPSSAEQALCRTSQPRIQNLLVTPTAMPGSSIAFKPLPARARAQPPHPARAEYLARLISCERVQKRRSSSPPAADLPHPPARNTKTSKSDYRVQQARGQGSLTLPCRVAPAPATRCRRKATGFGFLRTECGKVYCRVVLGRVPGNLPFWG